MQPIRVRRGRPVSRFRATAENSLPQMGTALSSIKCVGDTIMDIYIDVGDDRVHPRSRGT